jgi:translocation and assembly module TamA
MTGCSWFFPETTTPEDVENIDLPAVPYTVNFNPDLPLDIRRSLQAISLLVKLESRPPGSINALRQRIDSDRIRLTQALDALGYFDAAIDIQMDETKSPIEISIHIKQGTQYKISSISIIVEEGEGAVFHVKPSVAKKALSLSLGETVDLTKVKKSAEQIRMFLRRRGYAHTVVDDPEGDIDREHKTLHVTFRVKPGVSTIFGKSKIYGLKSVNEEFVRHRLLWKEGDKFDERKIDKTRKKLIQTGLFSTVTMVPSDDSQGSEEIPYDITVVEGPARALGAGFKYSTSEKYGAHLYWHHNNFLGGGEHFGISGKLSTLLKKVKLSFDLPDFLAPQQKLLTELRFMRERTRGYIKKTASTGAKIERHFTEKLIGSVGVNGEFGSVLQETQIFHNRLVSVPLNLKYDGSNNLLNPSRGGRVDIRVTPYAGFGHHASSLLVSQAKGTLYFPVLPRRKAILAAWGKIGFIQAKSLSIISPDKRFYSGGGGSVRGYGYQLLGPVDANRVPIGGQSLIEMGIETRFRINESFGLVTFLEGGSVSTTRRPAFNSNEFLWGAGAGIRYFTAIGPIRVDVGIPLKRRRTSEGRRVDSAYQLYISVGQAF